MRFAPSVTAVLLLIIPAAGLAVPAPPAGDVVATGHQELVGLPTLPTCGVNAGGLPTCTVAEVLALVDTNCDNHTCHRVRIDDDLPGGAGNVLDTAPQDQAANRNLYWGTGRVWHSGNDGHTSGLDADTVDGYHAADFASAGHDHNALYFTKAQLTNPGALNDPANPVDWTRLKGVPAGFGDGVDDNTEYAAGDGLVLTGTTLGIDAAATQRRVTGLCAEGFSIRAIDAAGAVACERDDDTTYAAGSGLALDGTTFAVAAGGITGGMILDGAVDLPDLAFDVATQAELQGHAAGADHDGRYYTEGESDARFLGLAATAANAELLDGLDGNAFLRTTGTAADSDLLDGLDSAAFAAAAHGHDERYYTEAESDGRFLGLAGKAADADLLDALDSSQLLRNDQDGALAGNLSLEGRLGIGTNSPTAALDVAGDAAFTGTLVSGSVPWARLTEFPVACGAGAFVTAVGTSLTCNIPPSLGGGWVDDGTVVRLASSTDRVGIGTSTPRATLHLVTNSQRQDVRIETTDADPAPDPHIVLFKNTSSGQGPRGFTLVTRAHNDQRFDIVDTTRDDGTGEVRFTIDKEGDVGIGTTAPDAGLHVVARPTQVGIKFGDGNGVGYLHAGGADVFLGTNDQKKVVNIDQGSHNVGIGPVDPTQQFQPTEQLEVRGNVKWSGSLTGGAVPWARLADHPAACPNGAFVSAIGSSLTCQVPSGGSGGGWVDDGTVVRLASTNDKVGIRTSAPEEPFQLGDGTGSGSARGLIDGAWNSAYQDHGRLNFNDQNFGIGAGQITNGEGGWDHDLYLWSYNEAGRDIRFMSTSLGNTDPSGWATNMIVKGDTGRVGIGTTSPETPLHVKGSKMGITLDTGPTDDVWTYYKQDGVFRAAVGYRDANQGLTMYVNGADRAVFNNAGQFAVGTTSPQPWSEVEVRGGAGTGGPNADLHMKAAGGEAWNLASAEDGRFYLAKQVGPDSLNRITVDPAGNVGIGTNQNPAAKLDVAGDATMGFITPKYTGPTSVAFKGVTYTLATSATWGENRHLYARWAASAMISWAQAKDAARHLGGYLATVTDQDEQQFVQDNVLGAGVHAIGLTDARDEGRYEWITGEIGVTGENAIYSNWEAGEPNNSPDEDAVEMFGTGTGHAFGQWNDVATSNANIGALLIEYAVYGSGN